MSDEDVIRRRLLIDGDGTGDDRRLNVLLKMFNKWCNTPNLVDCHIPHDKMLIQLAQCEFAVKKSQLANVMSHKELSNYEKVTNEINCEVESVKQAIENCKLELQKAKVIRKNKMEYDILAKLINEQSDRKKTEKRLNELHLELTGLEQKLQKLKEKMDMRKKQFHALIASAHQLQAMLDENDQEDSDSEDMIISSKVEIVID